MGRVPKLGSTLWPSATAATCFCHRVDFIAKYLGGLREQEKRIKCLESQVGRQTGCALLMEQAAGRQAPPTAPHPNIQTHGLHPGSLWLSSRGRAGGRWGFRTCTCPTPNSLERPCGLPKGALETGQPPCRGFCI